MFGLNNMIKLVTTCTFAKFPEATKEYNKNCVALFDVVSMVVDELVERNGELFVEDYTKNFVSVKDLALGDKIEFYIAE